MLKSKEEAEINAINKLLTTKIYNENTMLKIHKKDAAFSLLELSVVLLVLGLMLGGIMAALTQDTRRNKQVELKIKMDAIEQALGAFVKKNDRLPCPADGTYAVTSAYFGKEGGTVGDGTCSTGATYDAGGNRTADTTPPTANFILGNNAGGVIPVQTLGLPHEYGFDPWGGRFTYAVDKRLTATAAFSTYSSNDTVGGIIVYNTSLGVRTSNATAVFLSHGQNGHGAFQLSGTRKTAGSINDNEQRNCSCDSSAVASTYLARFVMGAETATSSTDLRANFDDTVRYYTRGSFLNNPDTKTEIK